MKTINLNDVLILLDVCRAVQDWGGLTSLNVTRPQEEIQEAIFNIDAMLGKIILKVKD